MEKKMETTIMGGYTYIGFREKRMETTVMGCIDCIGTTIRIHSVIPS